ncbi:hypothetical protein BC629DRAFT_1598608 [Irpex lacteus]|nr:hypothetical protein BC629DRAFT_1598608 [Irpex lacteus]
MASSAVACLPLLSHALSRPSPTQVRAELSACSYSLTQPVAGSAADGSHAQLVAGSAAECLQLLSRTRGRRPSHPFPLPAAGFRLPPVNVIRLSRRFSGQQHYKKVTGLLYTPFKHYERHKYFTLSDVRINQECHFAGTWSPSSSLPYPYILNVQRSLNKAPEEVDVVSRTLTPADIRQMLQVVCWSEERRNAELKALSDEDAFFAPPRDAVLTVEYLDRKIETLEGLVDKASSRVLLENTIMFEYDRMLQKLKTIRRTALSQ